MPQPLSSKVPKAVSTARFVAFMPLVIGFMLETACFNVMSQSNKPAK